MSESVIQESSDVLQMLQQASRNTVLRFSTAGSVDDGKSTLIGRLLHDSKNIYEDHLEALHLASDRSGISVPQSLALLTDGLKAEREQGITIDVAYRYFSTPKRHFVLADTPGHVQYTRNMATGASTADLMVLLIDARNGVLTQSRRHAFIGSLLGVPRFLVTVNKMDAVGYAEDVFEKIRADFVEFAAKLGVRDLRFIPISALCGDNVVSPSSNMPWYHGETVMDYLENVYVGGDLNLVDFRFPVQYVIRPNQDYRGYAGKIASGEIREGDEVTVLPSMKKSRIRSIDVFSEKPEGGHLQYAHAPMSVSLSLEDEIDISRGDMIVRSHNLPNIQDQFEAMVVWMGESPLDCSKPYIILHTTRSSRVFIDQVRYAVDVNTLSRSESSTLQLNEVGRVVFTAKVPLFMDTYRKNRATGNFVLVDANSLATVAAGMIIDRVPSHLLPVGQHRDEEEERSHVSAHIHREESSVARTEREEKSGCKALTLWFTGLSGSGKSSLARGVERVLFDQGRPVYRLDGDNLRFGLNSDLGFSKEDRSENIRRAAEVARLFNQAGVTVLCAFISPFKRDRDYAREIVGDDSFAEVFISTPLEVCEERDPNGLYKKAREGEIREFTGVTSPYEPPENADIAVDTSKLSLEESVERIVAFCRKAGA